MTRPLPARSQLLTWSVDGFSNLPESAGGDYSVCTSTLQSSPHIGRSGAFCESLVPRVGRQPVARPTASLQEPWEVVTASLRRSPRCSPPQPVQLECLAIQGLRPHHLRIRPYNLTALHVGCSPRLSICPFINCLRSTRRRAGASPAKETDAMARATSCGQRPRSIGVFRPRNYRPAREIPLG